MNGSGMDFGGGFGFVDVNYSFGFIDLNNFSKRLAIDRNTLPFAKFEFLVWEPVAISRLVVFDTETLDKFEAADGFWVVHGFVVGELGEAVGFPDGDFEFAVVKIEEMSEQPDGGLFRCAPTGTDRDVGNKFF